MLKINLAIYAALLVVIGYLYITKDNINDKLTDSVKAHAEVVAEKENLQTIIEIKEDIRKIMSDYNDVITDNQNAWLEKQTDIAKLNTEVITDVKNYMENPATSANTIDVSWVYSYNKSTERLSKAGTLPAQETRF